MLQMRSLPANYFGKLRFLPEDDNLLLAHANRSRVIGDEHRRIVTENRLTLGSVLLDGFVCGTWTIKRQRDSATLLDSLLHYEAQPGVYQLQTGTQFRRSPHP